MNVKIINGDKSESSLENELNDFIFSVENRGGKIILPIIPMIQSKSKYSGSSMSSSQGQDEYDDFPIYMSANYTSFLIQYKEGKDAKQDPDGIDLYHREIEEEREWKQSEANNQPSNFIPLPKKDR
jgi:hypothetical protein